jgi:hypothetical protein
MQWRNLLLSLTAVFVLVYCCCLFLGFRLTHPVVSITGPSIPCKAGKRFNIPILYHPLEPMPSLQQQLGQIDIYLFDQILRGNIMPGMRVLDAGCGPGRNLVYLLREGYEVPSKTFASKPSNPSLTPTTPSTSSSAAPSSTLPETTRTSTPCCEISGVS